MANPFLPLRACELPLLMTRWMGADLNRVFEYAHKQEIKKVKEDGTWGAAQLETIVHPNEYFKRSYLLKNLGKTPAGTEAEGEKGDVKMEG
jgi:DNA primase large subunit